MPLVQRSPLPKSFSDCSLEELIVCFVNTLYPEVPTKLLLVDILSRIPLRGMENFPWSVARITNIFEILKKRKIVDRSFKPSIEDGHALVCYFIKLPMGKELAEQMPTRLRSSRYGVIAKEHIDIVQARVYLYLNSEKLEDYIEKLSNPLDVIPYYSHFAPDDFFKKLKPSLQLRITEERIINCFRASFDKNNYKCLREYVLLCVEKNFWSNIFFYYFAFIYYEPQTLDDCIKKINNELVEDYQLAVASFLSARSVEDCLLVFEKFKEALKALRKRVGSRKKDFPPSVSLMYLFCLAKAQNDFNSQEIVRKEANNYLKNANLFINAGSLFSALVHNLLPSFNLPFYTQEALEKQQHRMDATLSYCIAIGNAPKNEEYGQWFPPLLKKYFKDTKEDAPFLATIFAQILSRILPKAENQEYALFLESHPLFDFSSLYTREISWEKRIEAISSFLNNDVQEVKKKVSHNPKRLVWNVDFRYEEITPYEQSFSKDTWTKGRRVSVSRLRDEMESFTYLTAQDKEVIKKAVRKDYWRDNFEVDYQRAIPLLSGHPLVFDEENASNIELILKEPELTIELLKKDEKDGYLLTFGIPRNEIGINVDKQNKSYIVTPVKPAHLRLKELMGEEKLLLPTDAHEVVLALVSSTKSAVKVRMNEELKTVPQSQVNTKPCLRLNRISTKESIGLEIQAVVYPLENHKTSYTPTKGTESFVAKVDTTAMKIYRDFSEEKKEMEKLLGKCPTLQENLLNEDFSWTLNEAENVYQILLELQEADVKLEWLKDDPITISKKLDTSDLKVKVRTESNKWFTIEGSMQVAPDLIVDMMALLKHINKRSGYFIPLENGKILALTQDFKRALEKIKAVTQEKKEEFLLHPLAVPAIQEIFEEDKIQSDELWKKWQEKLHTLDEVIPLPHALQAELRPYQIDGFNWLASLVRIGAGACLADDMGLGKTLQTIALILSLVQQSFEKKETEEKTTKPLLILAPTSVCHNWEREIARFAPQLKVKRLTALNSKKERKESIEVLENNEILILGYGLLGGEMPTLSKKEFKLIIFDEAQALKNSKTIRSKASAKLQAETKIALTGTPIENSLEDLWSIFNIINPHLLGSLDTFNARFNLSSHMPDSTRNKARNTLKSLVKPFILRRTKTSVLEELPPRTEQTLIIEPSEEERALYEALRLQALENIEKAKENKESSTKFYVLAELTRLRRACCNPRLIDANSEIESSKLLALLELIKDLRSNNHQVLIFSQFTSHLKIVFDEIQNMQIKSLYLDGSTPEKKRGELVQSFQNGQADIFCISLKAGGQGLNLTAADYVIHLDPWWNPAVEDQASDRAYRMGQTRPVTIYRLIMQDSVEEKILRLHANKRDLAEDVLANTDSASKLSLDDLMQLFDE